MIENRQDFLNTIARVFRILFALTGSARFAEVVSIEMVAPIATRMIRARNPKQFEIWLAHTLLDRAASAETVGTPAVPEADGAGGRDCFATIAALPPEIRSWAALRIVGGMSHRLVGEVLGLNQRAVSDIEEQLHQALAAARAEWYSASLSQIEGGLANEIKASPVPQSLITQGQDAIARAKRQQRRGAAKVFKPALIVGTCSFLIAVGLIGAQVWERMNRFPGSENVERLLAKAGAAPGKEFDELGPEPLGVKDWLFVAKPDGVFGNHLRQLPELNVEIRKARIFEFNGATVVEFLAQGDQVTVLLFSASQLGITLDQEGKWYKIWGDGWDGAVKREGDGCVAVATRLGRKHLAEILP